MGTDRIKDLVNRLEKATENDCGLFLDIGHAVFLINWERFSKFIRFVEADAWTDAALMLVPEGYWAAVATNPCQAAVQEPTINDHWYESALHYDPCKGATPAIALCIAALKAREILA